VPILILAYYLYMLAIVEYRFAVANTVILLGPIGNAATNGILAATGHLSVRNAVIVWAAGQTLGLVLIVWYVHVGMDNFGRADSRLAKRMVGFDLVRTDGKEASRQASIGFRAGTLLTLVSAVFLIAAAPFLCVTIFGSDFHGSIRDLRILALGAFGIAAIKQLGTASPRRTSRCWRPPASSSPSRSRPSRTWS
jgi:hypothetical protein